MKSKNLFFIIALLFLSILSTELSAAEKKVKNVILMIGDGMGLAQVNAARWTSWQKNQKLNMDALPVTGLMQTRSLNKLVTDSAASATAMATGHKTDNKMIAVTPDDRPLKTILQAAEEKGLATGMVATSSITHATPAAFATNVTRRQDQTDIAAQLIKSDIDVLLGGGWAYFIPSSEKNSNRRDQRDLLSEAQSKGYTVLRHRKELIVNSDPQILGLFARDGLGTSEVEPHIKEMTQAALSRLSKNSKGFILMIEGSQIDWGGHHKDANEMIEQTLLFDQAVGTAMEFARTHPGTLLIVTADHETGGMYIRKGKPDGSRATVKLSTDKHTAIDVPVFAYGPGAMEFTGSYDNTEIAKKIARFLKLKLD